MKDLAESRRTLESPGPLETFLTLEGRARATLWRPFTCHSWKPLLMVATAHRSSPTRRSMSTSSW